MISRTITLATLLSFGCLLQGVHGEVMPKLKSMTSELAKFKGDFLNIQNLESIAPEDMNILKDGLRGRGGSEKFLPVYDALQT